MPIWEEQALLPERTLLPNAVYRLSLLQIPELSEWQLRASIPKLR
jgi:hypothetical protein